MANFKPGPDNQGFTIVPPSAGGGTPVQIIALSSTVIPFGFALDPVTVATVQELTASGTLAVATYTGVYILPDPSFAATGDLGLMVTYTPQDSPLSNVRYISLNKAQFTKYTG